MGDLKIDVDYKNNKVIVSTKYDIKDTDEDPRILLEIPLLAVLSALIAADFTPKWADKAVGYFKKLLDRVPDKPADA